jgi:hypothetical protein
MRMDIDTYTKRAGRVELDGIDFDDFRGRPLDGDTLRCLRYMHDVEHHTVCYLRDLLVTSAHRDPEVTSLLTMWTFEEYWHGDAIGSVLAAHGEAAGQSRIASVRRTLRWNDRLAPTLHSLRLVAGRCVLRRRAHDVGAVNEWTTQAGYATQAERRLSGDRRAQRLTRFALRTLWKPVGSDVMPPSEVRFMVHHLFGDGSGLGTAERIDRNVDRLPGLAGLHLIEGAAAKYAA